MLSFKEFQALNAKRCDEAFHLVGDEKAWSFDKWCLALAGEVGELCNCVKKALRGDYKLEDRRDEILAELADIITYADLAISHLGDDTEDVLMAKFVEVSRRVGWEHKPTTEFMNVMGDVDRRIEEMGELVSEQLMNTHSHGICITKPGSTCVPFDAIAHIKKLETALLKAKSMENEEKSGDSGAKARIIRQYQDRVAELKGRLEVLEEGMKPIPTDKIRVVFRKWAELFNLEDVRIYGQRAREGEDASIFFELRGDRYDKDSFRDFLLQAQGKQANEALAMCVCGHPKSKHQESSNSKLSVCTHSWAHDHLTHWCTCNNFQAAE